MTIDRVGSIEEEWSRSRSRDSGVAAREALVRLRLLQKALRRRLLDEARPIRLSRRDPLGEGLDFSDLDEMAETLWQSAA